MLLSIFLQVANPVIDSINSTVNSIPVVAPTPSMSVFDILIKGGYIMIPIGILFATAIYIFIERFYTIRVASSNEGNFMYDIQSMIEADKIDNA